MFYYLFFIGIIFIASKNIKFKKNFDNITFKGITFVGDKYCPDVPFGDPLSLLSLEKLKDTGANWVAIVVTEYQDNKNSTDIYPIYNDSIRNDYFIYKTEKIEDLSKIIKHAHKIGLNVMLKPHIDLSKINDYNVTWRGNIGEDFTTSKEWESWFNSYNKFITKYAELAETLGVELFSMSCELIAVSKKDSYWRDIIRNVKKIYKGKLIDSANWGGEEVNKTWWDEMDYIGVDAYYAPIRTKDQVDIEKNIDEYFAETLITLKNLSDKFKKDIIITEVGFCSGNCIREEKITNIDQYMQAYFYENFIRIFSKEKYIKGFFWWSWNSDPYYGGMEDMCISPQYKLSEYILRNYYGGDTTTMKFQPDKPSKCKCTI